MQNNSKIDEYKNFSFYGQINVGGQTSSIAVNVVLLLMSPYYTSFTDNTTHGIFDNNVIGQARYISKG